MTPATRCSSDHAGSSAVRTPSPVMLRMLPMALLLACVDSTGPPHALIEETEFATSLGVDLDAMRRVGGGLYIQDVRAGEGREIRYEQEVTLAYDLHLPDGRLVVHRDSAKFVMGCNSVVEGLSAGIDGMRVGGIRRVVVPPRMGYGERAPWPLEVPPFSILVYRIEALRSSNRPCNPGS